MNRNQGAESTLAYLWTEMRNVEVQHDRCGDNRAGSRVAKIA